MGKIKLVFILDSISQPRCIKRINGLIRNGFDVDVYGFDRGKYNKNMYYSRFDIRIIGKRTDGEGYANRILKDKNIIKKIVQRHDSENVIYYTFGFTITLLLKLYTKCRYIYEISDILYGYGRINRVSWFFRLIDIYLIKRSFYTVFTSKGFAKYFFKNNVPEKIIVQPNKLDQFFKRIERNDISNIVDCNNIKFGYVGAFRSYNTIFRFARIIGERFANHEFHFFGESQLSGVAQSLSDKFSNVKFHGPYQNPGDLRNIYEQIDIVVACYDTTDLNERILDPNKLYESLFFKKPIIVSEGTYLEKQVSNYKCGFSLDASSDDSISNFIQSLSEQKIKNVIQNINSVNDKSIIDDDSKRIADKIKNCNALFN